MNSRAKGGRTFRKAVAYAYTFPNTVVIPLYQVSRWAQPQPFDAIVFRAGYWPRLVEVRSNAWGTGKPQTKQLAGLPGEGFYKQLWRFSDGLFIPDIRQWNGTAWIGTDKPWDEVG